MTRREYMTSQMAKLQSDEIIFNNIIPKHVRQNLTIHKVFQGELIGVYNDGSFSIAVPLTDAGSVIILFTVTMYNELFCKLCVTGTPPKTVREINDRIKELVDSL